MMAGESDLKVVLLGDVGGTNLRFAVVAAQPPALSVALVGGAPTEHVVSGDGPAEGGPVGGGPRSAARAGGLDSRHLVGETGKVRCKDGRGNDDAVGHASLR